MTLVQQIKSARMAGTPIVAVATPDQMAAVRTIGEALNGCVKVVWDVVRGAFGYNEGSAAAIAEAGIEEPGALISPVDAVVQFGKLPQDSAVLMLNCSRYLGDAQLVQALLNWRDAAKAAGKTIVLLGAEFTLPLELKHDVTLFHEPSPTDDALETLVIETFAAAQEGEVVGAKAKLTPDTTSRAVDALRGLPLFAAESVIAQSLGEDGLDVAGCWARKREVVAQTAGLTMSGEAVTPEQLGGLEAWLGFAKAIMAGEEPPKAIAFIDEIEKQTAGAHGAMQDSSGTSTAQVGSFLRHMEDNRWDGVLFVGHPGCAKSAAAKALAAHRPFVTVNTGAMKGSLVGATEHQTEAAMETLKGIGSNRVLVVATCNRLEALPPELRRRFTLGIWFFDLPSDSEKKAIWKIHLKRRGLPANSPLPNDRNWTGAEIRNCVDRAWQLRKTPAAVAHLIVPVAQSDPGAVERLREQADGSWLSATTPGVYKRPTADRPTVNNAPTGRKFGK